MVIGNGLIARGFSAYREHNDVLIFASGTANSAEHKASEFEREVELVTKYREKFPQVLFVYFGSCSVEDPDRRNSHYALHKLNVEKILASNGKPYLIFRLPVVVSDHVNPHTLLHYFWRKLMDGEPVQIWKRAVRYPIDLEHVVAICSYLMDIRKLRDARVNVALRAYPAAEIFHAMQNVAGSRTAVEFIDKGSAFELDNVLARSAADELGIEYGTNYLEQLARKYFRSHLRAQPVD